MTEPTTSQDTRAAEAPPAPRRVTGLSCPGCGGALEVAVGLRVAHCPYCSTPLLALGEVGVRRFAVEPRIEAEEAQARTRSWWQQGFNKHRGLAREARTAETFLCFLPFFRIQADVVGYALGTEQRQRTVGSGKHRRTETYEVDVERRAERHFDSTYPAVNVAEWGVRRVNLGGDRLIPFDGEGLARQGMVFPPTVSEPQVREAALASFRQAGDPSRGLHRTRFQFLETVRERFSVIYYPLWVVRYRFAGRSYQALIDAESGELAYGKAPGNDLYRAAMLIGAEAVVCFVATTAFQVAEDDGCGVVLFVLIFAAWLLRWAWRRFRYGGVIEEGAGFEAEEVPMPQSVRELLDKGSSLVPAEITAKLFGAGARGRRP